MNRAGPDMTGPEVSQSDCVPNWACPEVTMYRIN